MSLTASAVGRAVGLVLPLGSTFGWGIFGLQTVLHMRRRGLRPIPLVRPTDLDLDPLQRFLLAPALADQEAFLRQSEGRSPAELITTQAPVLHGLGNGLLSADLTHRVAGRPDHAIVFLEDTHLDADARERARRFETIVCGSSWNREVLAANGVANAVTCVQGIDPAIFHPGPRRGALADRFVVFSGGKLEYRKGQDIVVAAFRAFRQRHPDALLMVTWSNRWHEALAGIAHSGHVEGAPGFFAGQGGRLDLVPWLARNGLPAEAVLDLGVVQNRELGPLLREADVALFPNRAEGGTNLVAMECIACGVPTIVADNTGQRDLAAIEGVIALTRQRPVVAPISTVGTDGWGETSIEEAVETLERVYQKREAARAGAASAAEEIARWNWATQIDRLTALLRLC
jgi:glycosyltransferase involved in cell wall biosynthesis